MTLEQQLTALCEAHGLNHLSIHVKGRGGFYVSAHRSGECRHSDLSDHAAIAPAIADAIARLPVAEITDLAPMGEAA